MTSLKLVFKTKKDPAGLFSSVFQLLALLDSLFKVSHRVQSWKAAERKKTGKTSLLSHCRIYFETPPWEQKKQLLEM